MNIISFSLWGTDPKYLIGALENIKLSDEIYPGWKCRFYVNDTVPQDFIKQIKDQGGDVHVIGDNLGQYYGMFWRFFVNDDPTVDYYIIRDADCRLNYREQVCVEEWMKSGKSFNTIHDHFFHKCVPILGGMWGGRTGRVQDMYGLTHKWHRHQSHGDDQLFLRDIFWPLIKNDCLRHDNGYELRYGPANRIPPHPPLKFGGTFVGEIFESNNQSHNPVPLGDKRMIW